MIQFQCGRCKQSLTAEDRYAGKPIVCPECGAELSIPAALPSAVAGIESVPSGVEQPDRMLSTQVIGQGWCLMTPAFWTVIGAFLVFNLLTGAANSVPYIGVVAAILVTGPLALGWNTFCLRRSRGGVPTVGDVFEGFSKFGPAVGASVLMGVLTGLASLFFIIPGIFLSVSFSFTYFLMVDRDMGPWEAMVESYHMSEGYRWRLFVIGTLCSGLNLLGLMCLGVGFVVTGPIHTMAVAKLYDRITMSDITAYQKNTSFFEYVIGIFPVLLLLIGVAVLISLLAGGIILPEVLEEVKRVLA